MVADTATAPDETHPLDWIRFEVSPRYCATHEYLPPVSIDIKRRALQRLVYDLNQRMS